MKPLRAQVNISYSVGSRTKKLGMGKGVINSLWMCQLMAWSSERSRIPGRYLAEFLKLWGTWGSRAGLFASLDSILVFGLLSDILIAKYGWFFSPYLIWSLCYLTLLTSFILEMFFLGYHTLLRWVSSYHLEILLSNFSLSVFLLNILLFFRVWTSSLPASQSLLK